MVRLLPINPFSRPGIPIGTVEAIVWHWVGNAGKGVEHTARYFEILAKQDPNDDREDRYASAHFIIDREDWLQVVPITEVAYHAGSRWWNKHSIGIEICHPDWTGEFPKETLEHLYEKTAFLMRLHGLHDVSNIKRHFDITGKICPKWFVDYHEEYEAAQRETLRRI